MMRLSRSHHSRRGYMKENTINCWNLYSALVVTNNIRINRHASQTIICSISK